MNVFLILMAVVALATIAVVWFPETTKLWTKRIIFARKVLFAAAALIIAFIFIGTLWWPLVLLGGFTIAVSVWAGYFQFYKGEEVM